MYFTPLNNGLISSLVFHCRLLFDRKSPDFTITKKVGHKTFSDSSDFFNNYSSQLHNSTATVVYYILNKNTLTLMDWKVEECENTESVPDKSRQDKNEAIKWVCLAQHQLLVKFCFNNFRV